MANAIGSVAGAAKKKISKLIFLKILLPVTLLLLPFVAGGALLLMVVSTIGGAEQKFGSCNTAKEIEYFGYLRVTNSETGEEVNLSEKQLAYAATFLEVAQEMNLPPAAWRIVLMVGLAESRMQNLANDTVPESLDLPNDGVGSDHDSVGILQARAVWGSVADRLDPAYSARAFFGGSSGPNGGSPQGLLDIEGWETLSLGEAAQAVQDSAHPDRYEEWETAAEDIITAIGPLVTCESEGVVDGQAHLPLDPGYVFASGFGPREQIGTTSPWHAAIDLLHPGDPCGQPVYAILPGKVTYTDYLFISIQHPDGFTISYLHIEEQDRYVQEGDTVEGGQRIGLVGNGGAAQGKSTGCHLDLRIDTAGNTNPSVAELPTVADIGGDPRWSTYVNPIDFMKLYGQPLF